MPTFEEMCVKRLVISILLIAVSIHIHAQDMVTSGQRDGISKSVLYDVEKFTDTRDRKLEDVLDKLPGMSKWEWNGGVNLWYNGAWVEKIYINGKDILGDNYLPVFNMKPEDVQSIEILENHVHVKVMKGVQFSDNAALNIILKPEASSGLSGSVKAGGGVDPGLYNVDLGATLFTPKSSSTLVMKADNTGLNLGGDIGNFGNMRTGYSLQEWLNVNPSMAPLSDQRVRFNNSLLGSAGTTINLSPSYDLKMNVSFHSENLKASSMDETTYYLKEGGAVVDLTDEHALSHQKDLEGSLTLLSNTDKQYLLNNLYLAARWRDVDKRIDGTFPSDQVVNTIPFHIKDEFKYNFPVGKNILAINVEGAFISRPQSLVIQNDEGALSETITSRSSSIDASATYNVSLGSFNLSAKGGGSYNDRSMITEISDIEGLDDSGNDSRLGVMMLYTEAALTYIDDKMQAELTLPFKLGRYDLKDNILKSDLTKNKSYFSPSLSVKYEASENLSLSAGASYQQDEVNRRRLYSGLIFQDFRRAVRGIPSFNGDKEKNLEFSFAYTYPEQSLFLNGSLSGTWSRAAFINVMDFTPNYIISGLEDTPEGVKERDTKVEADISKGIESLKGKIGLGASFSKTSSTMVRNSLLMPFAATSWSLSPNVNGRIFPWLNTIYSLNVEWNKMKMTDEEHSEGDTSHNKGYTQTLETIFTPWEKFNFSFLGEHYYTEFADDVAKHLVLVDFKAEYLLSDNWVLQAAATNILNQETYNYTLVDSDTFSKSYTSYVIRPRNLLLSVFHKF